MEARLREIRRECTDEAEADVQPNCFTCTHTSELVPTARSPTPLR